MPASYRLLVTACLALGALGCGGTPTDRVHLVPVTGKVTIKGQPAAGARLRFHSPDASHASQALLPSAKVKEDGAFAVGSYLAGDGLPPGDYVVTLVWEEPKGKDGEMVDRLGGRYASPEKSSLKIHVEDQPTELDPFVIP